MAVVLFNFFLIAGRLLKSEFVFFCYSIRKTVFLGIFRQREWSQVLFLSVLGKHDYFTLYLMEQQYLVDVGLIQSVVLEKTFLC